MSSLASFTGCMMGGALGDALGYPVEFMSYDQIIEEHGVEGVKELLLTDKNSAEISYNTQMTLFTAEGLIWAEKIREKYGYSSVAARCFCSYQRWLHTQSYPLAEESYHWMIQDERLEIESPLLKAEELQHERTPETICVEALREAKDQEYGRIEQPINRSRGAGAVVRTAPAGLAFHENPKRAFEAGCDVAAITHTHPSAYYAAGFYSALIAYLTEGSRIEAAVRNALRLLERCPGGEEVKHRVEQALNEAKTTPADVSKLTEIGEGFVSSEVLAMGIYCALCHEEDYKQAVSLAVNQDGNSAGVASICGSLLGVSLGITGLEPEWIQQIEGKEVILQMASKLYSSYE